MDGAERLSTVFAGLSHSELLQHKLHGFTKAGGSRPAVWLLERDGFKAVLKDYHACASAFGRTIGPLLVRRETRALAQLDGIRGVPRLLRVVDSHSFLMEHIAATRWKRRLGENQPRPDFARLAALVAEMHARGIAHCDMRSASNILIAADGEPYLVDFVAHFRRGAGWNPLRNWLFGQFCRADDSAVAKLKSRIAPDLLEPAERAMLESRSGLDRLARFIGGSVRNLSRGLLAGKRGTGREG